MAHQEKFTRIEYEKSTVRNIINIFPGHPRWTGTGNRPHYQYSARDIVIDDLLKRIGVTPKRLSE